jgi:hypothetical protein
VWWCGKKTYYRHAMQHYDIDLGAAIDSIIIICLCVNGKKQHVQEN